MKPPQRQYVTVDTFGQLPAAQAMRATLEAAGFDAVIPDEAMANLYWGVIPAMGGLRVQVPSEQMAAARAFLDQQATDDLELPEEIEEDVDDHYSDRLRRRRRTVGIFTVVMLLLPTLIALLLN